MIHDYTVDLLVERGYIASSNWRDSDGPFLHSVNGKPVPLVEVPKDPSLTTPAYDFYTDSAPNATS